MSPEQAVGQPLGPTADVYALGVTMYELVTATLPFEGRTFTEVLAQQVQSEPEPPAARRPDLDIPAALNGLILACMAKLPGNRPQSAQALAAELDRIAHGHGPTTEHGPATGHELHPASSLATAETMDLRAMTEPPGPASASGSRAQIAPRATTSSAVDSRAPHTSTVSTAQTRAHGRGARARMLMLTAAISVLAAAVLGLALWRRSAGGNDPAPAPPAPPAAAAPPAALAQAAAAPPTHEPAATAAPGVDAAPGLAPDADRRRAPAPTRTERDQAARAQPAPPSDGANEARRARKRDVARHLAAAEDARRQGNRLKQMAEADSALQLERGNRQAAFLLGDALLAGGDEENACKYLRRARALTQARAALRRANCAED
jgi:serine/threonine-protein kinase